MAEAERDPALQRALDEFGCAGGDRLCIDGVDAQELVDHFGTPLYVFSARVLTERVRRVQAAMGPRIELLWSIKANPSVGVTECLRRAGTGAEIASLGEMHVAITAGHPPASLRFAGPGKTDHELDIALAHGLGTFHVESADELQSLAALAAHRGVIANVALRVNLPTELRGARMRMGGRSSRFGIDADQVPEVIEQTRASDALRLRGLHVYGGTQCFDASAFVAQARALVECAEQWERELGVYFEELDLGGGFGTAVFAGDPCFDLEEAGRGVRDLLQQYDRTDTRGPQRRWFVELGRYLAAPAGAYLTRVVRCKTSGAQQHVALDGGMHQAAAPAGLGTIVRRPPLLVATDRLRESNTQAVSLGGPLCTPADQFADQVALPELRKGDLVAVLHAGAYGLTYSPSMFLSHATPAEVMVQDGELRVLRERGAARDALRGQNIG